MAARLAREADLRERRRIGAGDTTLNRGVRYTKAAGRRRLATLVAVLAIGLSCGPPAAHAGDEHAGTISQGELLALIEAGDAPAILDVRTRREYEAGHVPGAMHMPFWAVLARASVIASARDRPVVVYCEHGPRAGLAKVQLRMRGFAQVLYLEGHMEGWKESGLPVAVPAPVS